MKKYVELQFVNSVILGILTVAVNRPYQINENQTQVKLYIIAHQKEVLTLWFSLQAESNEYQAQLAEQTEWLQKAEEQSAERGQQVEELQKLLGNMEIENGILKDKMAAGEAELLQLKAGGEEAGEKEQR